MWDLNKEYDKWYRQTDSLTKENFDFLKQSLDSVRFYSKCLSGATYYPVNDLNNIYDVLSYYIPRNWYVSSPYSITAFPSSNARTISSTSSVEYFGKYSKEYGLTLKNLFTPNRLINDSLSNFIYVDVCSTDEIQDLTSTKIGLVIDGVSVREEHRVLVKNQKTFVTISNSINTDDYFFPINYYKSDVQLEGSLDTEYYYYNESNGVYVYRNSKLVRESDLDLYDDCVRYSICSKLGTVNKDKQFHLTRMRDGYYPCVSENLPIEFIEKHNWVIRNRVDYNNVLDLNFYDVIKHATQSYYNIDSGITYSIPPRFIGVGEFGSIINYQNGIEHIINNKYKVNIRSIVEINGYYWVCGDEGVVLKVSKIDFSIQKSSINVLSSLVSISFFNDLRGVVVGDINVIYYTDDGGHNWYPIVIDEFSGYNYNKVLYHSIDKFYVGGDSGVFLEFVFTAGKWVVNKKRVAKYLDTDDEYILVEDINSIVPFTYSNWGLSYSYSTASIPSYKEGLMLVTNNNNFVIYNLNSFVDSDFIYLDFATSSIAPKVDYGDVNSVTWRSTTGEFYFSSSPVNLTTGIYSFDINNFQYISSSVSNVVYGLTGSTLLQSLYVNEIRDFDKSELLVCGNNSLFDYATYSYVIDEVLDSTFNIRLKSKLLFLDYDIASKLNFFDDQQNYRLPNPIEIELVPFGYYDNLTSVKLQALSDETNWLTYWSDRSKTFEYYSLTPLSDLSKVEMSFSFDYYNGTSSMSNFTFSSSSITTDLNDIMNLAPMIGSASTFGPGVTNSSPSPSRYNGYGNPAITAPSSSYVLYFYDYLMVLNIPSSYPAEVGDVYRLDSEVVTDNFIINKVVTIGLRKYCYFYTEFNQNITNQLKSSNAEIVMTNLNKCSSIYELVDRFNIHPISLAYGLTHSTLLNSITISPKFNSITAYYNLASNISATNDPDSFVIKIDTTKPGITSNNEVTVPMYSNGIYTIDWGDGNIDAYNVVGFNPVSHTYSTPGEYIIKIGGNIISIVYYSSYDCLKLIDIIQWGTTEWLSFYYSFVGCSNMNISANDSPDLSLILTLEGMFMNCSSLNGDLSNWNTSTITDMNQMFFNCYLFNNGGNSGINNWDVSQVVDMHQMFVSAQSFNQNIVSWNVSQVTNMSSMLSGCHVFNQNLGNWNLRTTGVNISSIFSFSGMSTNNYTDTIVGWANYVFTNGNLPSSVSMTGQSLRIFKSSRSGGANFASAGLARTYLTTAPRSWIINGDSIIP